MTGLSKNPELVQRACSGDREAFSKLLEEHLPVARAFLLRLGVASDDLDDLTQEVFVAVIGGLQRFQGASQFSTWVLGIALNVSRAWRRRRGPESELPADAPGPSQASDHRLLGRERGEWLRSALLRLPAPQREAFVLRHVEDLPVGEVAVILGIPAGSVRRRTHQARQRLRGLLSPEESTHG